MSEPVQQSVNANDQNNSNQEFDVGKSYDDFPYDSYPFPQTRPEAIYATGKLFSFDAQLPAKARVLSIGCSYGMELIPFALNNPDSSCLGIDISKKEIEHGQKIIKDLEINNVELKAISVSDIDESYDKFDYIICHGVISWVPDYVKNKIFEVCKNNLAENGIAFISYNVFPGWNMANNAKDMMRYHAKNFNSNIDKLQQGKFFLDFVNDALTSSETPYALALKKEIEFLKTQKDYYIFHEYIEGINKPFYFHEFVGKLSENKLNYLADSQVSTMFHDNLPKKAAELFAQINDLVKSEQYCDFIYNRRFRNSLVVHEGKSCSYNVKNDVLKDLYLITHISISDKNVKDVEVNDRNENLTFYFDNNKSNYIQTNSPYLKATFIAWIDFANCPVSINELLGKSKEKLHQFNEKEFQDLVSSNILKLIFANNIHVISSKISLINYITDKPKVSKLVRYQAASYIENEHQMWVCTNISAVYYINVFEKYLLQYLDGTNDKNSLIEKLCADVRDKKFSILDGDKEITDEKIIKEKIEILLEESLQNFRKGCLLIE